MDLLTVMERVQIRLIQSQPFYASLLSMMRKIPCEGKLAEQIPTEAVAVENGRINFYYNPKFLETLTVDEAMAVMQHECGHLILSHLTRMRDEYKENPTLANISQDACVNMNIQHLPKGCITVQGLRDEFAKRGIKLNLKDDDTAENHYKELNKHSNRYSVETDADGNMELVIKDPNGKEIGRMKIQICSNKDKQSDGKANGDIPELAKEVIRQAIKEAHDATMKAQGHLPAGLEEAINEWLKPPVIPWQVLLKKFLAASIKSGHKQSWKRPNRRFGHDQKGRLSDRIVSINIAVDTSGSISDEDFKAFISEMKSIQSCYKGIMQVMECDADIQHVYKLSRYNKVNTKMHGRGGTDFKPIFNYIKDKKLKTDILIFFTDTFGDFPSQKPPYATIWVSTQSALNTKVPWGHIVSLADNPDKRNKK